MEQSLGGLSNRISQPAAPAGTLRANKLSLPNEFLTSVFASEFEPSTQPVPRDTDDSDIDSDDSSAVDSDDKASDGRRKSRKNVAGAKSNPRPASLNHVGNVADHISKTTDAHSTHAPDATRGLRLARKELTMLESSMRISSCVVRPKAVQGTSPPRTDVAGTSRETRLDSS